MIDIDELRETISKLESQIADAQAQLQGKEDELRTSFQGLIDRMNVEIDTEKYEEFQEFPQEVKQA